MPVRVNRDLSDGKLSEAQFYEPGGLTILDGRIYVADVNNHAIRVIDMKNETVGTLQFSGLDKLEAPLAEEDEYERTDCRTGQNQSGGRYGCYQAESVIAGGL